MWPKMRGALPASRHHCDGENSAGERECRLQHVTPLLRIIDDVENEAKIYEVRLL